MLQGKAVPVDEHEGCRPETVDNLAPELGDVSILVECPTAGYNVRIDVDYLFCTLGRWVSHVDVAPLNVDFYRHVQFLGL